MCSRLLTRIRNIWKDLEIGPLPPTLILLGVLLYFYAFAALENSAFEKVAHDFALSFFIVGLFSLLIEFGHIKEYISRRLRDVVMRREYLQILDAMELNSVKRDVDSILFGRGVLEKGTLFRFIDDLRNQYIGSHYRERSRDFITIEMDPECPEAMVMKRNLSYFVVKGDPMPEKGLPTFEKQKKPSEPMIVMSKWSVDVIGDLGTDIEKYLTKLELTIKSSKFNGNFALSKKDDGILELASTSVSEAADPIPIKELSPTESVIGWEFNYEVPRGEDLESGEKIEITTSQELRLPKDDMVYVSVTEPTNGLVVNFRVPKGYKCRPASFGLVAGQSRITKRGEEEVVIVLEDWILPGHGWAVAWFPEAGGEVQGS